MKLNKMVLDNKKIEEATRDYINKNGYFIKYDEDPCVDIEFAYKEGAKWAINEFLKGLWHDASEEPDVRHKTIICLYKDGDICQDNDAYDEATEGDKLGRDEFNWDYYAEENEIKKWCYNTDLLPNEGGEQ